MGDLEDWSLLEARSSSPLSPPAPPRSPSDHSEFWERAEEATRWIIAQVQPTLVSEDRRRAVIDYVQRLVKTTLGCEVYPFGSVPLKTYLPDGDIDLTAFGMLNVEEALASDVCSVLEREEQNMAAQFVVKDVQLIRAEVKLVKCLVQNIVVDISFNQLGGLCTLCFLEKIDRMIGKDHLFKQSIILIKTWCYYESRILGAHHGLISTYALETLVLYIFHLFHSSLDGPLAVLYKFLDYFSKFDWDNYCISLKGPVRLSSLPDIAVEAPENGGGDLLLSSEFLKECMEMFSAPSRGSETNLRAFPSKHLNIIDPLRENNNLGRSVSKGNFYRIRSAFTYGARKLGGIISQAEEDIAIELRKFFSNTLDRHGRGERPDVHDHDSVPFLRYNGYSTTSPADMCHESLPVYEPESSTVSGHAVNGKKPDDHQDLAYGEASTSRATSPGLNGSHGHTAPLISEKRFVGDAKDLATLRIQTLDIGEGALRTWTVNCKDAGSPLHHSRNREIPNVTYELQQKQGDNHGISESRGSVDMHSNNGETAANVVAYGNSSGHSAPGHPNMVSDLAGDDDNQLHSLQFGRWWFDYVQNGPPSPLSPPPMLPHSQFKGTHSWEVMRCALPFRRNVGVPLCPNRVVPRQGGFFPVNPQMLSAPAFGIEELPKPRGTGTYFPNANHYRDRPYSPRGRTQHASRSPRNNGRSMVQTDSSVQERSSREPQHYTHNQGGPKNGSYDENRNGSSDINGSTNHPHQKGLELRSTGRPLQLQAGLSSPDGTDVSVGDSTTHPDGEMEEMHTYHLTNEEDFPPL